MRGMFSDSVHASWLMWCSRSIIIVSRTHSLTFFVRGFLVQSAHTLHLIHKCYIVSILLRNKWKTHNWMVWSPPPLTAMNVSLDDAEMRNVYQMLHHDLILSSVSQSLSPRTKAQHQKLILSLIRDVSLCV
jgi:hypothetical protein